MPPVDNISLNGSRPSRSVISGAMEMIVGADIPFIKPGGKRSRVRSAFDDGGRLLGAYRRVVAKMPFLDLHERQEHNAEEENAEEHNAEDSLDPCRRCQLIDLDGIFNSPSLSEDIKTSEIVLTLGPLDKNSPCTLCRFFYSMRQPSLTELPSPVCSTAWAIDSRSESQVLEWRRDISDLSYEHMSDRPQSLFLPQFTEPCPYPEETMKGLLVSETSVNYPLLRHWIKECEGHPDCSFSSTNPTKSHIEPTIRGIDCTTRNIVDLRPGDSYIALSYVWGNQPLVENKGSRVLPTHAPKVIEDAMIVVKELGQQYLWVDQYCINQHDDQDKHAQIKNMDRIYEGSYATIVAFSGVDSSSGLPGVSGTPRMPQHRFTSSKVTLLGFTPSITRQSFEASIWMKRGWTFQEALLSRRLLIFTQEQVYFVCSRGWWVESSTPSLYMTSLWKNLPGDNMSFQSDALDAVRGLLSRVSVLTFWGIPAYDYRQPDFSYVNPSRANVVFVFGLFWQPDRTVTDAEYLGRRGGFPSWSWLGWRTPVAFKFPPYNPTFLSLPVAVEDTDGTLRSIPDLVELYGSEIDRSRMLPVNRSYIWLKGVVFALGFQPDSSRHDGELCFCFNHPLGCSDYLRKGSCTPKKCEGIRVEVRLRLNVKASEEIWRTTLAKKWSCLCVYSINGRHHFLILDEGVDSTYSCVGTLYLDDFPAHEDLLEKLKAKVPHEYRKVRIG
ncbi:HET-domain-containing protein [Neurospora crassa]|nr:HET-domain-containing protein [Neurospora crassa]